VSTLRDIGLWFLELYDSGKFQSLPLTQLLWIVAVFVLGTSVWKMGRSGTISYIAKRRLWLLAAVVAGIAIPLMLVAPWKPRTLQLPAAMYALSAVTSLALILVLAIIATFEKLTNYWRRYLRTLCIPDPPAQAILVVSAAIFVSGSILYFFASPVSLSLPEAKWPVLGLELVFWIVAPLLRATSVPESKARSVATEERRQEPSDDYWDDPITTDGEDLLGRSDFAHRLADEIISLPGKGSFVFGLVARWGEGKTSVLNLIKRKLELHTDIIIVDFNPWYFANQAGILEAFYGSIERAIEERFLLPSFKRRIRQYLKTLSIGLEHKPFSLDLELPENPEHLREELEGFIARTGARLVILVDDIDRLDHDLALGALALTRLSARFENTIFLLAIDPNELEKNKIGSDFLSKIIQKPIVLPPAELRDIDEFFLFSDGKKVSAIDMLLDQLGVSSERKSQFHNEIDMFYGQNLRGAFLTLRDVKRFLNVLRPSLAPVIEEVKLSDFFLLTVLQVFAPEIYKDIWENRQYYLQNAIALEGFRFSYFESDKEARKKQIQDRMESMLAGKSVREDIKVVLVSLFPDVATALGSMIARIHQQRWGQEQRLSDPVSFPRYFLGRIPSGRLGDGETKSVIRRWNEPDERYASSIADDLERYALRKQIQQLVERLTVFADTMDLRQVPRIALGVAEFTTKTNWDGEQDSPSPNALFKLALALANRLPSDFFPVASQFVECGSIYLASDFLSRLTRHIDGQSSQFKQLIKEGEARLRREFIEGGHDVFTKYPRSFQPILCGWATAWDTRSRSDEVESYVVKIIENHPAHLGRFLVAFSQMRDAVADWFIQISAVIGPRKLAELISRFERLLQSGAERSAAETIKQAIANAKVPPNPQPK
jgi:hypothetical protein